MKLTPHATTKTLEKKETMLSQSIVIQMKSPEQANQHKLRAGLGQVTSQPLLRFLFVIQKSLCNPIYGCITQYSKCYFSSRLAAATKLLQSCPTLYNPIAGSLRGPPFLGFSRQEHWSGLPFPSPMQESKVTLRDPMDCSLPGSSAHGIFQARLLEWGSTAFSEQQTQGALSSIKVGGKESQKFPHVLNSILYKYQKMQNNLLMKTHLIHFVLTLEIHLLIKTTNNFTFICIYFLRHLFPGHKFLFLQFLLGYLGKEKIKALLEE